MNTVSYKTILNDIKNFRRIEGDFSGHDTPTQKYFKIFFHFENNDIDGNENHTGLLAPTWLLEPKDNELYTYNSAWSYLRMNNEIERSSMLEDFVSMLSNISSNSPWYFAELGGLEQAIERKQVTDRDFKIEDSNKRLTIKCLPDAYDDRISTLLDLYRTIIWSWQWKREVLPANLRKFDMSILVFDTPTRPYSLYTLHDKNIDYSEIGMYYTEGTVYNTSYKLYEFHNCEIDYNSTKSGIGAINNGQGVQPEYTIEISYDDCYESRYNEFLGRRDFGDLLAWDNDVNYDGDDGLEPSRDYLHERRSIDYEYQKEPIKDLGKLEGYPEYNTRSGILSQLVETGLDWAKGELTSLYLGNIYGFSLAELGRNAKDLLTGGNLLNAVREGVEFWREQKTKKLNPWELNEDEIREEIGSLNLRYSNSNISDSDRDYADHINNMNQSINITLSDNSLIDDTEEYGNRDYNDHINNMNQPITETLRDNSSIDDAEEFGDRDYNDHINNMNTELNINIFKKGVKYVNNQSMKLNGISIANNL